MKTLFTVVCLLMATVGFSQNTDTNNFKLTKKWQSLLDEKLSNWEVFVGVPHTSVELEGHPKSENVHKGKPLGLNNDPKKVMTVIKEEGDLVLKVSGEIYAGLTSLDSFGNYHLKVEFKWGEKKYAPRLEVKRDNGILYHCHGEHGAFWNVWMSSLECQIQEHDMGDFVSLVHARALVTCSKGKHGMKVTGEGDKPVQFGGKGNPGYCHINKHNEKPNGEWNTVEVICVDDTSIHVVNGKVVMVVTNAQKEVDGVKTKLTEGKLQLQSEGAEAYYKNISIKSVKKFPKKYRKQVGL